MTKAFLAIGFAFGGAVGAAPSNDLEAKYFQNIRCKSEVFAELDSMHATREWTLPSAREMDGSRRFHSPTQVLGVWTEARIFMNGEVILRRITANYVETRVFDLETCKLKQSAQKARSLFDVPARATFTDRDLRTLMEDRKSGLIYIWSPNMPYSYQQRLKGQSGIEIVREVGRKLGLHVTVVLDPAASGGLARQVISQNQYIRPDSLRSAQSLELSLRAMRTHYPALIVYAGGKLSRHGYPGLGTEQEYTKYIKGELHELQK